MKALRMSSALVLSAVTVAALAGCAMNTVNLADTVLGESGVWELNTNAVDVTDKVCDEALPCSEAARSDQADYFRFDSVEEAAAHARSSGSEAHISNFIVIVYRDGGTSSEDQSEIEQWIDGFHKWG